MTTEKDDVPLNDNVPTLTISDDPTSENWSSILTITNTNHCRHTKPVNADETDEFSLGWQDTGSTDMTDLKHIPPLPEVLQFADSPYADRPATTDNFIRNEGENAYWNQIASLVEKPGSVFLYDRNSILF